MMINSVTSNRRLILSAKHLYFFHNKREEELGSRNNMAGSTIDNELTFNELSVSEDNESYILGYN